MLQAAGRSHYRSYLLRLWRPDPDDLSSWHASLHDTLTDELHNFAAPADLWAFLRAAMELDAEPPPAAPAQTSGDDS